MKSIEPTEVHPLTVREIGRLVAEFNSRRRDYTEQLAALFSATAAGQPEPPPATERAEQVRGRALQMLNGHSPDSLKLPRVVSRRQQLEIDVEACDRVLEILSPKELAASAQEAADFALAHGQEWAELCRDIILCATRLGALERRAIAWRASLAGAVPASLPLSRYVGTPRSIVGVA